MSSPRTLGWPQEQPLRQPVDRRVLPAAPLVDAAHSYARRRQQPLHALMDLSLLRAFEQAERHGQLTVLTGERICEEVLGWHPRMVWGELYDQVVCERTPHHGSAPSGTTTAYRAGCRCLDCREANAATVARTTHRVRVQEGGERSA
jgi:hypothetical protein